LKPIAVVAFLLGPEELVHRLQSLLPVLDRLGPAKLVLRVFHDNATAVEAHTAQSLERGIDESIVVDRTG